jgi:hypothetical protein
MNMKKKYIVVVVLSSLFCSCAGLMSPGPKSPAMILMTKNDVSLKDSWTKFISQNPAPKVVLRVPGPSRGVTQEQMSQLESFYNYIEKKLLEANFTIRDRSLLTTILEKMGDQPGYEEIGKKIDTDIIVEIGTVKGGEHAVDVSWRPETSQTFSKGGTAAGAVLEGRLILVSSNEVVGIFTLKALLPEEYFVYNAEKDKYDFVMRPSDADYLHQNLTAKLVALLKGSLTDQITPVTFVFDRDGHITREIMRVSEGKSPISSQAKASGNVSRVWLGVRASLLEDGRVEIVEVEDNSPASLAELKEGDVILKVDGKDITSPEFLAAEIQKRKPGDVVSLAINRGGKTLDIKVELGDSRKRMPGAPAF